MPHLSCCLHSFSSSSLCSKALLAILTGKEPHGWLILNTSHRQNPESLCAIKIAILTQNILNLQVHESSRCKDHSFYALYANFKSDLTWTLRFNGTCSICVISNKSLFFLPVLNFQLSSKNTEKMFHVSTKILSSTVVFKFDNKKCFFYIISILELVMKDHEDHLKSWF